MAARRYINTVTVRPGEGDGRPVSWVDRVMYDSIH